MTMENNFHTKIYDFFALIFLLLLISSCNRHTYSGVFAYYGNKEWKLYNCLQLDSNNSFEYIYFVGFGGIITSGKWTEESEYILLNSTIQDIDKFPLNINIIEKDKYHDTTMLVLQNINWCHYDWYCVFGRDTVKVNNDTLVFITQCDQTNISFYVRSKSLSELHRLSLPNHCFAMRAPISKYAKSADNKINTNCIYAVKCDSIFGNNPLNYVIFNNEVLKKDNGKLIMEETGFVLKHCRYGVKQSSWDAIFSD